MFSNPQLKFQAHTQMYPGNTQSQRFLPSSVVMESLYFFHSAEFCEFFLRLNPHFLIMHS